jgi:hypothetical protein
MTDLRHISRTLVILLAGCVFASCTMACSSAHGPGVATLGGTHSTTTTATDTDGAMVAYAHCMRSHGSDVPDPVHRPGHAGLSLDLPVQDAAFHAADAQCNHYLAGLIAMKQAGQAQIAASHMTALIAYARCMRGHQIPMLDPDAYGGLNLGRVAGITGDVGRYSPEFRAADQACRHLLPAGAHDDGTGP